MSILSEIQLDFHLLKLHLCYPNDVINVSNCSNCHIISLNVLMLKGFYMYIKQIFIMMDKYFNVSNMLFLLIATSSSLKKKKKEKENVILSLSI